MANVLTSTGNYTSGVIFITTKKVLTCVATININHGWWERYKSYAPMTTREFGAEAKIWKESTNPLSTSRGVSFPCQPTSTRIMITAFPLFSLSLSAVARKKVNPPIGERTYTRTIVFGINYLSHADSVGLAVRLDQFRQEITAYHVPPSRNMSS